MLGYLFEIIKDVSSELLDVVLIGVYARVLIPLVGCKSVGDASA